MTRQRQRQTDHIGPAARIGLVGAECSGKSTLAAALAGELPACLVGEELRDIVVAAGRTPTASEQAGILQRQAEREETAAAACALPWLVADPAPLMTAVYSIEYFDDDALIDEGLAHARGYDLLVWCAPDVPWVADGLMRDGPERRASTEETIARILRDADPASLPPVVRVAGDVTSRVRSVTSTLAADRVRP